MRDMWLEATHVEEVLEIIICRSDIGHSFELHGDHDLKFLHHCQRCGYNVRFLEALRLHLEILTTMFKDADTMKRSPYACLKQFGESGAP